MTKQLRAALPVLAAILWGQVASAIVIVTGASDGTPVNVVGITGFTTTGAELAGAVITVNYADQTQQSCVMVQTFATISSCENAGFFDGFADGDTFDNTLDNDYVFGLYNQYSSPILSFTFNLIPGNAVWDLTFGGLFGTPSSFLGGSARGRFSNQIGLDAEVSYTNVVNIGANPPVRDLYGLMTVIFPQGMNQDTTYLYSSDADSIGDVVGRPVGDEGGPETPEPASFVLVGSALAVLGWRLRVRR